MYVKETWVEEVVRVRFLFFLSILLEKSATSTKYNAVRYRQMEQSLENPFIFVKCKEKCYKRRFSI